MRADLIVWDNWCHREVGLSLEGESCGAESKYQCVEGLSCAEEICYHDGSPTPLVVGRDMDGQTVSAKSRQLVVLRLVRGPVHPCHGGSWLEKELNYNSEHLMLLRHEIVANAICPAHMKGCHHEMDQFVFRVWSNFKQTKIKVAMGLAPRWCHNPGTPIGSFTVNLIEAPGP